MKEIPETTIFHVVIEEKVPREGQGVPLEANQIPMLDTPHCLKFCLEFLQALIVGVEFLDGHWLAILKDTFVYRTRCTMTNYILLTQVFSHSHDVVIHMKCHIHVKDH
jgi:hypothetical protein